jgi:Domain of unknown function (DUF4262)
VSAARYTDEERAENDRRVASDVKAHGCHVVSVFDAGGTQPDFSYSIGIADSAGAPDALVIGLGHKLGHAIINRYCRRAMAGERFARGVRHEGFLDDFPVLLEPLRPDRHAEYTLGCARYYRERPYSVVQIVWPSTRGAWPWQKGASDWLVANQPLLGRKRPDRK